MSDSEENPAAVPEWQRGASEDQQPAEASQTPEEDRLDVARRFLEDHAVEAAPRDKKVEFLKSKGIEDTDIQKLLGEPEETTAAPESASEIEPASEPEPEPEPESTPAAEVQNNEQTRLPPPSPAVHDTLAGTDRPPVVTYPEFLTKPQRPPPLVTTNGLLNTLYAFAGLSTILYGASKHLVAPMVENLTDARTDLHQTTSRKLDTIVSKLEETVSVVPPKKNTESAAPDEASDVDDPSEMFHRDVGTQTSLPTSPSPLAAQATEPEHKRQADRLSGLSKSLSGLNNDFRTQSSRLQDVKTLLDGFRDDLDGMTYGGRGDFVGGFDIYGKVKRPEPEDEIRKVRDNIRRIKGVLLSTRSFPTSAR